MQRARSEAESGVREGNELAPNPNLNPTAVENIGALTAAELEEIAEVAPKRGLQSGAFIRRPDGSSALDWKSFRAPPPPPPAAGHIAAPRVPERAELVLADLSLQFDNPFFGSSLLPPPPKKRPWLKPLLITAAGTALLCAGYAGALYHQRTVAVAAVAPTPTVTSTHAPAVEHTPAITVTPASVEAAPVTAVTPATTVTTVTAVTPEPVRAAPAAAAQVAPAAPVVAGDAAAPAKMRAADAKPRRARTRARTAQKVASAPTVPEADAAEDIEEEEVVAPAPKPAPTALLTRVQVKTGLEAVRSELNSCAAGRKGQIMANVTIAGTGHVSYATIEGDFSGTPQGSCMARALRGAQFPAFTAAPVRVRYPFVF